MSDATKEKFTLTDEQRSLLEQLEQLREGMALSQEKFSAKVGFVSGSTWSKITKALKPGAESAGSYFEQVNTPDKIFLKLETKLRQLAREAAQKRADATLQIHALPDYALVIQAIEKCLNSTTDRRIVGYTAPTGAGKTYLCKYLVREKGACMVETRYVWLKSYYTVLTDTARALGLEAPPNAGIAVMENLIAEVLRVPTILIFDEAEFFGAEAINFVKWLVNRTPTVPVFFAPKESFDSWLKDYRHEARQLQRRFHTIVPFSGVQPDDVVRLAANFNIRLEGGAHNLLANAANEAGAFCTVADVLKELAEQNAFVVGVKEMDRAIDTIFALKVVPRLKSKLPPQEK